MKVFILEFKYFDGVEWDYIYLKITARTKIQLIKAFLKETEYMHENMSGRTKKELWAYCKKRTEETELTFPLIEYPIY